MVYSIMNNSKSIFKTKTLLTFLVFTLGSTLGQAHYIGERLDGKKNAFISEIRASAAEVPRDLRECGRVLESFGDVYSQFNQQCEFSEVKTICEAAMNEIRALNQSIEGPISPETEGALNVAVAARDIGIAKVRQSINTYKACSAKLEEVVESARSGACKQSYDAILSKAQQERTVIVTSCSAQVIENGFSEFKNRIDQYSNNIVEAHAAYQQSRDIAQEMGGKLGLLEDQVNIIKAAYGTEDRAPSSRPQPTEAPNAGSAELEI